MYTVLFGPTMATVGFQKVTVGYQMATSCFKGGSDLQLLSSWGGLVGPPLGLATFFEKRY